MDGEVDGLLDVLLDSLIMNVLNTTAQKVKIDRVLLIKLEPDA